MESGTKQLYGDCCLYYYQTYKNGWEAVDIKVTYIHHSSFMAELDHAVPLFDYSEGDIPEADREKPLFMSISHRHGNRFSCSTFDLGKNRGNVTCVLSDGIWTRQMLEDLLGKTVFPGSGEEVSLKDGAGDSVDIQAFKSTGKGVAFLISLKHRTIYHARDLNNWVQEGEPEADNRRMSKSFYREMDKLAGRYIDVAFILIDPRQEEDFYLRMGDFMRVVGADAVSPAHFREGLQATTRFKALTCASGYKDRIQEIYRRGEESLMRQTDSGRTTLQHAPDMDSGRPMK